MEEKTKSLDSLEEEKKRYTDKIIQYKDRMIAMKARIEELENTEKILNKNLEEEVKQKNGNFIKKIYLLTSRKSNNIKHPPE